MLVKTSPTAFQCPSKFFQFTPQCLDIQDMFDFMYLALDFTDVVAIIFESALRNYGPPVDGLVYIVYGHPENLHSELKRVLYRMGSLESGKQGCSKAALEG